MTFLRKTLSAPYQDPLVGNSRLTISWERFFQALMEIVSPISFETTFVIENNVSVAKAIEGLQFDPKRANFYEISYIVKRIKADGPSSAQYYETGKLNVFYRPGSKNWGLWKAYSGPDSSGVTFSINTTGQVLYTSSNLSGNILLSTMSFRVISMSSQVSGNVSIF